MGNSDFTRISGAGTKIDWAALGKAATYQVHTGERWATVTRAVYATIHNPQNRRVLLKDTQTIINAELFEIPK
jgi:hypothetical protein